MVLMCMRVCRDPYDKTVWFMLRRRLTTHMMSTKSRMVIFPERNKPVGHHLVAKGL
jgi:hypothetical protein